MFSNSNLITSITPDNFMCQISKLIPIKWLGRTIKSLSKNCPSIGSVVAFALGSFIGYLNDQLNREKENNRNLVDRIEQYERHSEIPYKQHNEIQELKKEIKKLNEIIEKMADEIIKNETITDLKYG